MDPLSGLFFSGSEENLPPVVSSFFWTVQKVHQFWRYGFDVQRITQSSQNTYAYFAGFTMQKMGLADGATGIPIKWLAQLAFAMDTASRVSFQIERVNYVYHKLCDTLTGRNPAIRSRIDEIPDENKRWRLYTRLIFNPATDEQIEEALLHAVASVDEVARLSLQLVVEVFILSNLCLMYLEALSWSEASQNYAVQMFFLNWQSVLAELHENKALLRVQLETLQPFMEEYLGCDAEVLIKGCETSLDLADFFSSLPKSNMAETARYATHALGSLANWYYRSAEAAFSWWYTRRVPEAYLDRRGSKPTFGELDDDDILPPQDLWRVPPSDRSFTVLPVR